MLGLLSQATWRLAPLAWEAMHSGLSTTQWILLGVWVAVMAHAEGYRGFHRRFSPRVAARAQHLAGGTTVVRAVFAPFFCMSLFGASRRGMIVARSLVTGIVGLVLLVRMLPQPWRGIVDAGVVVGLAIGATSVVYYVARAMTGAPPAIDPDLGETPTPD